MTEDFTNSASFMGGFEQDSHEQGCQSLSGIPEPHENDVLMGRGGKNNQHSGNEKLRKMARSVCAKYASASKKGKSEISRGLVQHVRKMKPPGRFLRRDPMTCTWEDVGDEIAREKASQVLRDAVSFVGGPLVSNAHIRRIRKANQGRNDPFSSIHINLAKNAELHGQQKVSASSATRVQKQMELEQRKSLNYRHYLYSRGGVPNGQSIFPGHFSPYRPPVTPSSASVERKRSRYQETPIPTYAQSMVYSPSSNPQMYRPNLPNYDSNYYGSFSPYPPSTPSSARERNHGKHHLAPSSVRSCEPEPWVADINPYATCDVDSDLLDIDLFAETEREGAISPFLFLPDPNDL